MQDVTNGLAFQYPLAVPFQYKFPSVFLCCMNSRSIHTDSTLEESRIGASVGLFRMYPHSDERNQARREECAAYGMVQSLKLCCIKVYARKNLH